MIFGMTEEEKYKWHRLFAWWPVRLNDDRWVWLQWYWRRYLDAGFWILVLTQLEKPESE